MSNIASLIDSRISMLPPWAMLLIYISILLLLVGVTLYKKWLKLSGAGAAFILGLFVLYFGGFSAFFILLFFLIAGTLVGKVVKDSNPYEKKGSERDWSQVAANGIPALLAMFLYHYSPYGSASLVAYSASLAEALADTWAGDIGRLSHKDPVSIITFTKVPKGISGGVTLLGFIASLIASFLVSTLYIGTYGLKLGGFMLVAGSGFLGSVLDSVLGATIQVHYRDEEGILTEKPEIDGKRNQRVRGIPFINNDAVNLLSGLFSFTLAFVLALIIL